MQDLRWVAANGSLEKTPSTVTGITYTTTDQVARQVDGEVQIDRAKLNSLSDKSKIALVVHEVLLSFFSEQGLAEHKKTRALTCFFNARKLSR